MRPSSLALVVTVVAGLFGPACSKSSDADDVESTKKHKKERAPDDEPASSKDAASASAAPKASAASVVTGHADGLVEQYDFGTIAWKADADGKVTAQVADRDGAPLKAPPKIALQIADPADPDAPPKTVPLEASEGGTYTATVPAFTADLTPVSFTTTVGGSEVAGTIHVPAGGTAALMEAPAPTVTVAADATGPHGGVVQVVGDDRYELVSDAETAEVRVFMLDAELRPIAVTPRAITLGVVADRPETVVLARSPDGLYFTAGWGVRGDPTRGTMSGGGGAALRGGIVGWRPGARLVVGAR
ncbi:MAG: hypothetical protein ACHREM_10260, partial [Polyangiales bacterium]